MGAANFGCGSIIAAGIATRSIRGGSSGSAGYEIDAVFDKVKQFLMLLVLIGVVLFGAGTLANIDFWWATENPVQSKIVTMIDRHQVHSKTGITDVFWKASTEADPAIEIEVSSRDKVGDTIKYKRLIGYFTGVTVGYRR